MKISGKVIVITGGTKGLGAELKKQLSAENTVVAISRSAAEDGKTAFAADVANRAEIADVFKRIAGLYGRVDMLINNAGSGISGAAELIPEEEARRSFDVNYFGAVNCAFAALPYMPEGAKIVNICSMSAIVPMPFRAYYNSAKAALGMFSYSLKLELASSGVDVTAIYLGDIATDFASHRQRTGVTSPRYGENIAAVDAYMDRRGKDKKMPLDIAAGRVIYAAGKKHYKIKYFISAKYKLVNALATLFPELIGRLLPRFFGI